MWSFLGVLGCASAELEDGPEARDPESIISEGRNALAEAGVTRIRWGMTSFRDPDTAQERWAPLWDHVGQELGVEVEVVQLEAYEGVEGAMRRGEIDGATFRPWAYVDTFAAMPLQLVCTHVVKGSSDYGAYVIMLEDQSVRDVDGLSDLAGGPFGFVHPKSTSGFVYPASMLLREGVHPLDDLQPRWYGSHSGVFDAVANGKVLAGAVYSEELDLADLRSPGAPSMRIIAKSERIPYSAYVLRQGLPEAAADALQVVLNEVSTQDPEGREILLSLPDINGFLPISDKSYDSVRSAAKTLDDAEIDIGAIDVGSGG